MNIRPFIQSDIELLIQITTSECQAKLNEFNKSRIFVAEENNTFVGWYYLYIPTDLLGSCFIFIYIAPDFRRKGFGKTLYRHAEEKMLLSGFDWWTSYPSSGSSDNFAISVGFDYTNENSYMEYDGGIKECSEYGIRQYCGSDYPTAPDIWTNEYAKMHIRLGLPYNMPEKTTEWRESERTEYENDKERTYVIKDGHQIVGIGSMFYDNDGIGSLAVDSQYANKGYGTRLAIFLTNECIRRGCTKPCVYCETNNISAFHLYQKIGYREISRESVAIKQRKS